MNEQPLDGARFEDLVAAGVDERTIDVARALASARRAAPASLVGVRWAAVAEVETVGEPVVARPAEPAMTAALSSNERLRRTVAGRGSERRWWPQLLVGTAAVALVALLWLWAVPWLSTTTIRRPEGRGDVKGGPAGPDAGTWTIVDQIGGNTLATAIDGEILLAGRGRRLEAYDLSDLDAEGRPRLLGTSPMLPEQPNAIVVLGDRAYVGLEEQPGILVFDTPNAHGRLGRGLDRVDPLAAWHEVPTAAPLCGLTVDRGTRPPRIVACVAAEPGAPTPLLVITRQGARERVTEVRDWTAGRPIQNVAADHGIVFCALYDRVLIADLSDPADPKQIGELDPNDDGFRMVVSGQRLYVAPADDRGDQGVAAYDLADPRHPTRLGMHIVRPVDADGMSTRLNQLEMAVDGDRMAVAYSASDEDGLEVDIVDIGDMAAPRVTASRHIEGFWSLGLALGKRQVAFARLHDDLGSQLDVIGLAEADWITPAMSPPPLFPPRAPLLASPAVRTLSPWDGGLLLQSDLDVIGARFDWPRSRQPDSGDRRPAFGADSLRGTLGFPTGWRIPSDAAAYHAVVAQAASGDRAAAIVVRDGPGRRVDFGLLAWTGRNGPATWPLSVAGLDRRIAWTPLDRLLDPGVDARNVAYDAANWHLSVGPRYAVASHGWTESQRIAIFDMQAQSSPATIHHGRDVVPSIHLDGKGTVAGFALREDLLIAHDGVQVVSYRIEPGGTLAKPPPVAPTATTPFGLIERIVATDRGLLIVSRQAGVQLWPYDAAGVPRADRARFIGSATDIHPRGPSSIDAAAEGDRAYIAGDTGSLNSRPQLAFVREIDLARGRLGPLVEFPLHLVGSPLVAAANDRLYFYRAGFGITVLERRAGDVRSPAEAAGATR